LRTDTNRVRSPLKSTTTNEATIRFLGKNVDGP
jgi:hypothetical protein